MELEKIIKLIAGAALATTIGFGVACGGGGGGSNIANCGLTGGSGGGAGNGGSTSGCGGTATACPAQGNAGGNVTCGGSPYSGGGGGGSTAVGESLNSSCAQAGDGGTGERHPPAHLAVPLGPFPGPGREP